LNFSVFSYSEKFFYAACRLFRESGKNGARICMDVAREPLSKKAITQRFPISRHGRNGLKATDMENM